jgi:hypothetical protein
MFGEAGHEILRVQFRDEADDYCVLGLQVGRQTQELGKVHVDAAVRVEARGEA